VLASDQEYCLECGARRVPGAAERWRRPLFAAAVTVLLAVAVAVIAYTQLRSDADSATSLPSPAGPALKR
jgi:hypothetical protein